VNASVCPVSDGSFDYPRTTVLSDEAAAKTNYEPVVSLPYIPNLITIAGKRILLDTGAGVALPSTGKLLASLQNQKITPEMIDFVLLSHAHADHIGGLMNQEGKFAFPNARILIGQQEYDFWRRSGFREQLGTGSVYGNSEIEGMLRHWFDVNLLPLEDRLEFIQPEVETAGGILPLAAPGHTPGHLAFLIDNHEGPVLFSSDAFLLPEHIPNPEWTSRFDLDPAKTVETRNLLLDLAAADRCRVFHYHTHQVGRIKRNGNGFTWQPEQF
jgi:glyoxylase-like metal-dependent hydrolase (beta-lactamase superfamily II)